MAFAAQTDGTRLSIALTCDRCGAEIDDTRAYGAIVVVGADGACRFACGTPCLTAIAGDADITLALVEWWRSATAGLGFDVDDLDLVEEPEPPDAGEIVATIRALEDLLVRPGMPAGLSLSAALALGYLSEQHVSETLGMARDGVPV